MWCLTYTFRLGEADLSRDLVLARKRAWQVASAGHVRLGLGALRRGQLAPCRAKACLLVHTSGCTTRMIHKGSFDFEGMTAGAIPTCTETPQKSTAV